MQKDEFRPITMVKVYIFEMFWKSFIVVQNCFKEKVVVLKVAIEKVFTIISLNRTVCYEE